MSLLVNQLGEELAQMKQRAERAEAQVQAVRAECERSLIATAEYNKPLLRALNGDSDE